MVAEATLQRLVLRSKQFAAIVFEEGTAAVRKLIRGDRSLASLEGGRKHTKRQLGCDLQHHAAAQSRVQGVNRLLHRPPAGSRTISQTDLARAGFGGWV